MNGGMNFEVYDEMDASERRRRERARREAARMNDLEQMVREQGAVIAALAARVAELEQRQPATAVAA